MVGLNSESRVRKGLKLHAGPIYPPPRYTPNMLLKSPAAYAMGLTSGCGDAEKVENWGVISPPWNLQNAPLLPICTAAANVSGVTAAGAHNCVMV